MARRLFMLLALVVVIAAAWAALVTLFLPPLTLGWREFYEAMVRRWVRNVAVLGVGSSCSRCGFSSSRLLQGLQSQLRRADAECAPSALASRAVR